MEILKIKEPETDYDLHPLITKRWSPRSFSDRPITEEQLKELFEAARWAPSSYNEQPWQYVYAFRDTPGFEQLWNCLSSGNQPWTKSAAVLLVAMTRTTLSRNEKFNKWAEHDLGMANAQLLLQAVHRDIYAHLMAGFDADKVKASLDLSENVKPICMGALGYLGEPDQLEEPYRTREMKSRSRKPVSEFIKKRLS